MKTLVTALVLTLSSAVAWSHGGVLRTGSSVAVATCSSSPSTSNSYHLQVIRGGYHLRTRLLVTQSTFRGPVRSEYQVVQIDPEHRVGAPMHFRGNGVEFRITSRLSRDGRLLGTLKFANQETSSRHTLGCVWGDGFAH